MDKPLTKINYYLSEADAQKVLESIVFYGNGYLRIDLRGEAKFISVQELAKECDVVQSLARGKIGPS